MVEIRPVTPHDFEAIAAIYCFYVTHSLANFEEHPPSKTDLITRWQAQLPLPFIVATSPADTVVGYAHVKPYHTRSAYRFTVENSIYIHPDHTRKNIGTLLLSQLVDLCTQQHIKQIIARIPVWENSPASINLHKKHGFEEKGCLHNVGFKHNQFIDTVLMQKELP